MNETWKDETITVTPDPYDVHERLVRDWIYLPNSDQSDPSNRIDDTLFVYRGNHRYETLNDSSKLEKAVEEMMLRDFCEAMPPSTIQIAVLGAGLCRIPKHLWIGFPAIDIYELRQEIIDRVTAAWGQPGEIGEHWTWIQGDYAQTLPASGKTYHAIFYDIDGEPAIDLSQYLRPNGRVFRSDLYADKVRYLP